MSVREISRIGAELIVGDDEARALVMEAVQWLHCDLQRARRTYATMRRILSGNSDFRIMLSSLMCLSAEDFEALLQAPTPTDADLLGMEL